MIGRTYFYFKLIALTTIFSLSGFKPQQNVIPVQLNWDIHFKATPDKQATYAALTTTVWEYSYVATIKNKKLTIDFKFNAGIDASKSWVKRNYLSNTKTNQQLLKHEQGHVYLNYLLLKDGEKQIRNQNYTVKNYKTLIKATANKVSDHYAELQKRYDDETEHGTVLKAQQKWDEFIYDQLNKYL